MRPLTLTALPFIVLASILLTSISVKGQMKIGSIALSDEIAKAYFLDCYNHPDTLTREYVDGCGDAMEKEVKQYNEWLSYNSIKHIVVEVNHPARVDTIKSFLNFTNMESYDCPHGSIKHEKPHFEPPTPVVKGYKGHEKDFIIINSKEYIERVEIGFTVARKPSEQDFIKWFNKYNSTTE